MYEYEKERPALFTKRGVETLTKIRDNAKRLLDESGAFMASKAMANVTGDSWLKLAALDYMVERGAIRRVTPGDAVWGQHEVLVKGDGRP